MNDKRADLLVRNLLEVFNEKDQDKRLSVIRELYAGEATFYEAEGDAFQGVEQINSRVTEVLATLPPGAIFHTAGPSSRNHDLARLEWTLSAPHGPVFASGMDVALLKDDRIAALYLFINPAESGS